MPSRDPTPIPGFGRDLLAKAPGIWGRVAKDIFTDTTGQGYAIGRVLVVPLLVAGLGIPVAIIVFLMRQVTKPQVAEWVSLLSAIGPYLLFVSAAIVSVVTLTAPTDPGGAWWSKSNAPPPAQPDPVPPAPAKRPPAADEDPAPRVPEGTS
jgi:hypothetical protein